MVDLVLMAEAAFPKASTVYDIGCALMQPLTTNTLDIRPLHDWVFQGLPHWSASAADHSAWETAALQRHAAVMSAAATLLAKVPQPTDLPKWPSRVLKLLDEPQLAPFVYEQQHPSNERGGTWGWEWKVRATVSVTSGNGVHGWGSYSREEVVTMPGTSAVIPVGEILALAQAQS